MSAKSLFKPDWRSLAVHRTKIHSIPSDTTNQNCVPKKQFSHLSLPFSKFQAFLGNCSNSYRVPARAVKSLCIGTASAKARVYLPGNPNDNCSMVIISDPPPERTHRFLPPRKPKVTTGQAKTAYRTSQNWPPGKLTRNAQKAADYAGKSTHTPRLNYGCMYCM